MPTDAPLFGASRKALVDIAMATRQYLFDRSLAGVMEVVELVPGDRPIARFRETWFHPQGGGQRADRGRVGPAQVMNVRLNEDGSVDHHVDSLVGLEVGRQYPFVVDEAWRLLNSRFHTAAHLLVAVAENMFPGTTVSGGHQWPGEARVDFEGDDLDRLIGRIAALESAVRKDIDAGLPVRIVSDERGRRACRIDTYPPIPCSGTHVETTAGLGCFSVRSVRLKHGRLRVGYEVHAA